MGFVKEFRDFLDENKVTGLAIAFIMGAATTTLVQSLVNSIIMPFITPFFSKGQWSTATVTIGPVVLKIGEFLGALLNFLLLGFVVFLIFKKLPQAKPLTKVGGVVAKHRDYSVKMIKEGTEKLKGKVR